jgi:osmotically-inducible protein OsmY
MKKKSTGLFVIGVFAMLSSPYALANRADADSTQVNSRDQTGIEANRASADATKVNNRDRSVHDTKRVGTESSMSATDDQENRVGADNSKMNSRDKSNQAMNAGDQSNDKKDMEITQSIRKELVENDDLSVNAKNIKVITSGGKVVVTGPVHSLQEKNMIERIAVNAAGPQNVQNQITVTN